MLCCVVRVVLGCQRQSRESLKLWAVNLLFDGVVWSRYPCVKKKKRADKRELLYPRQGKCLVCK